MTADQPRTAVAVVPLSTRARCPICGVFARFQVWVDLAVDTDGRVSIAAHTAATYWQDHALSCPARLRGAR